MCTMCPSAVPVSFLFLVWLPFFSVAHSFICCSTNYQKELLCLHTSNVLFISFTILWEKNQKSEKMFRKNAKGKKKEKGRNELNCIFFSLFPLCYLFSEESVFFFCGIHKAPFPVEQHSVP